MKTFDAFETGRRYERRLWEARKMEPKVEVKDGKKASETWILLGTLALEALLPVFEKMAGLDAGSGIPGGVVVAAGVVVFALRTWLKIRALGVTADIFQSSAVKKLAEVSEKLDGNPSKPA